MQPDTVPAQTVLNVNVPVLDGGREPVGTVVAPISTAQMIVEYEAQPDGDATAEANPNGAVANIAGVLSENRRVLGMMPHPERLNDGELGGTDGARLFESLAGAMAA